jgi:uncharacterized protein with HEPN domain
MFEKARNTGLLLKDIQTSITRIFDYTKGYSFDAYEFDNKTKDAVERNFEIIGEAASRIPDSFKEERPQIEWRIIKDFRNFIIHDYFGINDQILWDTIQYRLPDLLKEITILSEKIADE